jgi:predicted nucleotidyltransferase
LAERLRERLFKAVLFGSATKGLCDVDSDVDLLVVVDRVSNDVKNIVADLPSRSVLSFMSLMRL